MFVPKHLFRFQVDTELN